MKTKQILISLSIIVLAVIVFSCDKMEDNYSKYLEEEKVYSPKVINLRTYSSLQRVDLAWDNPTGNIAKTIMIDYEDDTIYSETMIDTINIRDLQIKGYTISIYTMDEFGNLSVPETINVFPNGEE